MANWIEALDQQIADLLADWGLLTTALALVIVSLLVYPIFFTKDPDTHPLLLARQSAAAPVRNRNESALYRSPEVPHGYPLRTGLEVKEPGAPRWAPGKDGDLRDVWREVQRGGTSAADGKVVPNGKILTVLGREEVVEHDLKQLSLEIEILGKHFKKNGCTKVAIYLPNSIEFLLAVFACSFFGISPVMLPYNLPHAKVYEILNATGVDGLVCAAGNLPLESVAESCKKLKLLTWVVEKTSRHMDWNGVPESAAGRLNVSVWHDVVDDNKSTAQGQLPTNETGEVPPPFVSVFQPKPIQAKPEIVSFTQTNITSAIAALISALQTRQRFTADDMVLPASSFNINYVFCQTMAALYTHASLAITSVAEPGVDFELAVRGVSPTVVIASVETMARLHAKETSQQVSLPQKLDKYLQSQELIAGRMPSAQGMMFGMLSPPRKASSNEPGRLRLILTAERFGAGTPPLTSGMLSDLRIFTRARICYALTAAQVAGAIAQTNVFDYRREPGTGHSKFGIPVSSLEIKLLNTDDAKLAGAQPQGDLVVSGPSVSGGEARPGIKARICEDGTLAFAS